MYYQECERLAIDRSSLRQLIEKIDGILYKVGPSGLLRPDVIASSLRERLTQITGIFSVLAANGLLREFTYLECPVCSNLVECADYFKAKNDEDPYYCSQCQADISNKTLREVNAYRVNSSILVNKDKQQSEVKSSAMSDERFNEALDNLDDPFRSTPLLRYYSNDPKLLEQMPFKGKRVMYVLHFLKDLIPMIEASRKLGLEMQNAFFFYKDYPYPQRHAIETWLKDQGATVVSYSQIDQYLKQFASNTERVGEIVVVEDGGFIVPSIHANYPELIPFTKGAVEQTTRGIRNAENWVSRRLGNTLQFPLISVATSDLKNSYEPPYIAKAVVNNINRLLPEIALNGKRIAVFGCGAIGQAVATWLRENNAVVTIHEPSYDNKLWAQRKGFDIADSGVEAVNNKFMVIGASGNQSIDSSVISALPHGIFLASASSELYEIDMDELSRLSAKKCDLTDAHGKLVGTTFTLPPNSRKINVLANGYPVNFWGAKSMPDEASDLILSLILLSSVAVAINKFPTPGINSTAVNELSKEYKISKTFLEIHRQG